MEQKANNIDSAEIAKFTTQANQWWDLKGDFKALHEINPVRLAYVLTRCGLKDRQVLDVGCGGGLLAEVMAIEGARVTGIDMVTSSLAVAMDHAVKNGLSIDYQCAVAEDWAEKHTEQYDIVTCMELVEHVPDPARLVQACSQLVRPGGDLIFSTVNRTFLARVLVIWVSEYVLGIVRKGTHRYRRFVRPQEMIDWGEDAGLALQDLSGLRYVPYIGYANLCKSTVMNYMVHFKKER